MKEEITNQEEIKIIPTTGRNNCGGRCILYAHVQNGKILRLTTEHANKKECEELHEECAKIPLTACMRGMNYHKTFLGEDRLRYPMKRVGKRGEGKFQRITWGEAVDTIAREWIRIRDTYGPGSRYVNYAWGISALFRGPSLAKRLLSLDGGFLDYYNSYSTGCINPATELMYGTLMTGHDPKHWLDSKLIILWAHNPSETRFDSMTMYYLKKARKKQIPVIIIDPRKNDTVRELDAEWIPIRPATDSALADAMAYEIIKENLQDQEFLDRCCLGFDKEHMPEGIDPKECYLSYVTGEQDGIPKTAEWGEKITGIPAVQIRTLARRFATAKPAALIQGYGAQRHAYGEQSVRGGILLACLTGNIGISGGWASGAAGYQNHRKPAFPKIPNPYPAEIPVYGWTEALYRGTEMTIRDGVKGSKSLSSNIKMILNLGGNCLINQHGDINRTAKLLQDETKCEFIVCSDLFMTASAKFADLLLPGTSMFEDNNITTPWKYGDFLGFQNKCIEPIYEAREEYDWLTEVADRLNLKAAFTEGRTAEEWLCYCYENLRKTETELPPYEEFKKAGIYRYRENPDFLAFEKECQDPVAHPFPTESGKIEIFSRKIYQNQETYSAFFPAIPRYVAPPEGAQDPLTKKYPLQLIGWQSKRRCHTIHDNNQKLHKAAPQQIWMHPADAASRNLTDGQPVLVYNDRGRLRIPVKITDRIMPGVTALSAGAWYNPAPDGTDLAGSINVLTSHNMTPYSKGNPQHTILVEIEAYE